MLSIDERIKALDEAKKILALGKKWQRNVPGERRPDFEGAAGDFGVTVGTLHVSLPEGGAKSGTCTWMGQAFPDGSPWVVGSGEGTWEQIEGLNRWKLSFPVLEVSDGSRLRSEGELDLAMRSFNGQLFDAS